MDYDEDPDPGATKNELGWIKRCEQLEAKFAAAVARAEVAEADRDSWESRANTQRDNNVAVLRERDAMASKLLAAEARVTELEGAVDILTAINNEHVARVVELEANLKAVEWAFAADENRAATERAAVCAWLRTIQDSWRDDADSYADRIESGEHLKQSEGGGGR